MDSQPDGDVTKAGKPRLSVRSSADMITAVPYLLGFHPSDSVVVVALSDCRLVFAARGDLPAPGDSTAVREVVDHLAQVVGRQEADSAVVLGFGPSDRVTPVVDAAGPALGRAGLRVLDALRVTDGRYWSYVCTDPDCCPPDGVPFDQVASRFAAEATLAGQVALPDRATLVRQVAPVDGPAREAMRRETDGAARRLSKLLDEAPPEDLLGGRTLRRAGETAVAAAMHRYRTGGRLADDDAAWLTLLLAHLPVRDTAWERTDGEQWHLDLWTDMLRRAEPDLVPAPASLLTFAAWRAGQGTLAAVALDRALDAQPDYSMALLLVELLAGGVPPSKMDGWPRIGRSGAGRRGGGRVDPGDGRSGRRAVGRGNGPGGDCDGPGRRPRQRGSARRGVSGRGTGGRRGGPRCQ